MRRPFIFLILSTEIFFLSYSTCSAQNLSTTLGIADSLYSHGYFDQSIDLYKRIVYFDQNGSLDSLSFSRIANGYFNLNDFNKASEYFNYAFNVTGDYNSYLDMVLCQLLAGRYKAAKLSLFNIPRLNASLTTRKLILLSLTDFNLRKFSSSKNYLIKSADSTERQIQEDIFVSANKITRKYKKSKVKTMSLLLPGLGQAYSGDIKEGLNSFGLAIAFGALYIKVTNSLGLIDGMLSVLPWYQKFYVGGFYKSGSIAEKRQSIELNRLYNALIVTYENDF